MISCPICQVNLTRGIWEQHVAGLRHRIAVAERDNADPIIPVEAEAALGQRLCDLCSSSIPDQLWGQHLQSRRHISRERFAAFRAVLDEAERDKNGLVIEGSFDFGIVEPGLAGAGKTSAVSIKATTPHIKIQLVQARLTSGRAGFRATPSA